MTIPAVAGHAFDASIDRTPSGLEGVLGVRVIDGNAEATVLERVDIGIHEYPAGSGVYTVSLTAPEIPDEQTSPWRLMVLWDDVPGGEPLTPGHSFTEDLLVYRAAGAPGVPYFTIGELRARYPKDLPEAKYSDERLAEARTYAESSIEDECDVAFVPRSATESGWAEGAYFEVDRHWPRSVVSAVDENDVTITEPEKCRRYGAGGFYRAAGWPADMVTITYLHGYDQPPPDIKEAAMILAKTYLVVGPVADRALQIAGTDGATVNLSTPGLRGARFGIPAVDAACNAHRHTSFT